MTPGPGPSRGGSWAVLTAFILSGVAGLTYEVVWSRYLALFLGSGAYGQVAVLALYMSGVAAGAFGAARVSHRLASPLRAYAAAETALAALGFAFHPAFVGVTALAYEGLGLAPGLSGNLARGVLSAALVLPGAVVLGTTFPFMAAGLVREREGGVARPGRGVATAYLANTGGGAVGVLVAGFVLLPRVGLPGSLAAAAALNLVAAGLAVLAAPASAVAERASPEPSAPGAGLRAEVEGGGDPVVRRILLAVSLGTALASFGYEIAWTRLLALMQGSATHAFELMLSAFIGGLALGAFLVRDTADVGTRPLRLLGVVQALMGAAALATLPLYAGGFQAMAYLVSSLRGEDGGYALFNVSRYALSLLVMLPSTTLAGMTLPLLTAGVTRTGGGERAIGRVYGWNTVGAVVGVVAGGLVALPWLGARGVLVASAFLDVTLGVVLLLVALRREGGSRAAPWLAAAGGVVVCVGAWVAVPLDPVALTSGVYRYGVVPRPGTREVLYYRDGRSATVGAVRLKDTGRVSLVTNGKPDASLDPPWMDPRRDTVPVRPMPRFQDATTQSLAPLVALAHRPGAQRVANIGHGSGLSTVGFLSSPTVTDVTTLEIEPAMVEGSRVYLPANAAAFQDPRAHVVYGDARSTLAWAHQAYDVIFSEPSNPWVSGTAALFTVEFYRRAREALTPGGIFAQWFQLYEMDDALALSVLDALTTSFPYVRGYRVGAQDILLVARADGPVPEADWSVLAAPAVAELFRGFPVITPRQARSLEVLDASLFQGLGPSPYPPNSDFRPVLEYGTEAARFRQRTATGFQSLGSRRVDLLRTVEERVTPPWEGTEAVLSVGLDPAVRLARTSWLHAQHDAPLPPPAGYEAWSADRDTVQAFRTSLAEAAEPGAWRAWTRRFARVEGLLHAGTAGWVDQAFYRDVEAYLARGNAPAPVQAAVALLRGVGSFDFPAAARAADILGETPGPEGEASISAAETWLPGGLQAEARALTYGKVGRPADAAAAAAQGRGRGLSPLRARLLGSGATEVR